MPPTGHAGHAGAGGAVARRPKPRIRRRTQTSPKLGPSHPKSPAHRDRVSRPRRRSRETAAIAAGSARASGRRYRTSVGGLAAMKKRRRATSRRERRMRPPPPNQRDQTSRRLAMTAPALAAPVTATGGPVRRSNEPKPRPSGELIKRRAKRPGHAASCGSFRSAASARSART